MPVVGVAMELALARADMRTTAINPLWSIGSPSPKGDEVQSLNDGVRDDLTQGPIRLLAV
jgi:hypothetical protein